jgi:protein O-GlcNAc transferase
MEKEELLELYEARGEPEVFEQAKRLYEEALAADPDDARAHNGYGYLLECRGRLLLREALTHYECAAELAPNWAKPRFQLISAYAGLQQADDAVQRFDPPEGLDGHRLLATAYVSARRWDEAASVIDAGLRLFPDDAMLTELRGDIAAGTGHVDEALELYARAHEVDPETLSPVYSRVFLLQREDRLEEAAETWRSIIDWCERRGYALDAEWPRRELARVRELLARR